MKFEKPEYSYDSAMVEDSNMRAKSSFGTVGTSKLLEYCGTSEILQSTCTSKKIGPCSLNIGTRLNDVPSLQSLSTAASAPPTDQNCALPSFNLETKRSDNLTDASSTMDDEQAGSSLGLFRESSSGISRHPELPTIVRHQSFTATDENTSTGDDSVHVVTQNTCSSEDGAPSAAIGVIAVPVDSTAIAAGVADTSTIKTTTAGKDEDISAFTNTTKTVTQTKKLRDGNCHHFTLSSSASVNKDCCGNTQVADIKKQSLDPVQTVLEAKGTIRSSANRKGSSLPSKSRSSHLLQAVLQREHKEKEHKQLRERKIQEAAKSTHEKEKQIAYKRRSQQIQCAFPEIVDSYDMPPTSGRVMAGNEGVGANSAYNQRSGNHQPRRRQASSGSFSIGSNSVVGRGGHDINGEDGHASNNIDTSRNIRQQPTPLFERLVTEEVQELKAYARIIEGQQRRLTELERVHGDLEARLEVESRGRQHLEATLEAREREWANRFEELERDRDHWKEVVSVEQTKNSRLIDQVMRKDQDIQRMLQRKYDHEGNRASSKNIRHPHTSDRGSERRISASKSPDMQADYHKSPHEILAASGSAEKVRLRNVQSLLLDFFGM